jgi:galactose mutarotase-like enzyme
MPKHGFARDRDFAMITRDASEVVFRLRASDDTRSIYPFEFQLDLRFRVVDTTLHIDAIIANLGGQPMPASFGFHPAFRWPLLFNQPREEHRLVFDRDEPAAIRRIDSAGLMKAMSEPSPVDGRELALRDDLFVDDALIFDQVASRSLRYGASVGPQLRVDFPNFSILGVWTKPGAEFVCIEPWHGLPDPEDASGDIWAKPGIMTIDVGATRTLRMAIAVEL